MYGHLNVSFFGELFRISLENSAEFRSGAVEFRSFLGSRTGLSFDYRIVH